MKELQIFQNDQFGQLRGHIDETDQTWFCGKDIAESLDYPESSLNQLNNLFGAIPEEWAAHKPIMVRSENGVVQKREMLCLTEQGVYFFLGRSDKPKALPYQKWVAGEIMPSIRKTGAYAKAQPRARRSSEELTRRSAATSYRMLARMKDVYPAEMLAVFAAKAVQVVTGEPLQPLLPPVRDNRESWLSPTAISEVFGISRVTVGKLLKSLGLHGEADPGHKWSHAMWDKSPYSNKEVVSFIYDPAVVLPALKSALTEGNLAA